jgi:hypothetical protein
MFLIEVFKKNNWKLFEKEFTNNIIIRNRGAWYTKEIREEYSSIKMNGDLQESLTNGYKMGYLEMESENHSYSFLNIFQSKLNEYFFVLTNIGLLGFYNSQDKTPFCLIPVIGCTLA